MTNKQWITQAVSTDPAPRYAEIQTPVRYGNRVLGTDGMRMHIVEVDDPAKIAAMPEAFDKAKAVADLKTDKWTETPMDMWMDDGEYCEHFETGSLIATIYLNPIREMGDDVKCFIEPGQKKEAVYFECGSRSAFVMTCKLPEEGGAE